MKAWHFFGDKLRDGRPVPADGVKLVHDGELVMCESGLHFSLEPFDALTYAPGDNLAYVEVADSSKLASDKGVSPWRIILKRRNVRELLYDFACAEAWAVIKTHNPPDVVKQYLLAKGKERDSLRTAARGASYYAARDAAWYAAWDAARYAARDAAQDVAWYAARDAARYAAWDVARYAAQSAAWTAAQYAAWDAARGAPRERQRRTFNSMVYKAFGLELGA